MANNAIGSASVVLSANADGLAAGLSKAESQVAKFAGKATATASKAAAKDSKGGGLLSTLLLGGGIGAGLQVANKIWSQIEEPLQRLASGGGSKFDLGGLTVSDKDVGRLAAASNAVDRLFDSVASVAVKFGSGLGPGIASVADAISRGLELAWPLIDRLSRGIGAVLFVVGEVGIAFAETVAGIIDRVGAWITAQTGIGENAMTVEKIVLETARKIGVGFAYVWDGMKAGVRVVSYAAGVIVESLGKILEALARVAKEANAVGRDNLNGFGNRFNSGANRVLGAFGKRTEVGIGLGESLDTGADRIQGWADSLKGLGETMKAQGADALRDFGESAGDVNAFFDRIEGKLNAPQVRPAEKVQLAGAIERGSKEAYSAVVKNQFGGNAAGNDPVKVAKDQLKAELELVRLQKASLQALERIGQFAVW